MAYFGNEPAKVAVKVGSGVITATELADDSITTADIIDDAITPNQLDEDGTWFQVGTLGVGAAVSGGHALLVSGSSSFGNAFTSGYFQSSSTGIGFRASQQSYDTLYYSASNRIGFSGSTTQRFDCTAATFTGEIYGNDRLYLGTKMALDMDGTALYLGSTLGAVKNETTYIRSNDANAISIDSSQNSTFAGNITMPDSLIHTGDTDTMVRFGTDEVHLRTGGGAGLYVRNSEVEVYRVTTKLSNANAQLWVGEGDGASDIYMSKGDTGDEVRFSKNAAGNLDILTNGGVIHLNVGGDVGIGQGTPQSDNSTARFLHIGSSSNASSGLVIEDNERQWELYVNGNLNFMSGTTNMLAIRGDNGNSTFIGEVKIDAPGEAKLHLEADGSGGALLFLQAGNATGDPKVVFETNSTTWSVGLNNDDNDSFVIGNSATVGTNPKVMVETSQTLSLQNFKVYSANSGVDTLLTVKNNVSNADALVIIDSYADRDAILRFNEDGTTRFELLSDGTDSYPHLLFKVGGTERMRLEDAGLVMGRPNEASGDNARIVSWATGTAGHAAISAMAGGNSDGLHINAGNNNYGSNQYAIKVTDENSSNVVFGVVKGSGGEYDNIYHMNIAGNITGPTSFNLISSDTVKLTSTQNSTKAVCFDGYNFRPDASVGDNVHDCGTSNRRWNDIYATNSSIQTSDKNQKKEIKNSSLGLGFLNLLTPREYKWKGGTRKHYGLVAQEVEKVLNDNNIDSKDFAPFIKFVNGDTEKDGYGFRYGEMVGILIKAVQELSTEVEKLKGN